MLGKRESLFKKQEMDSRGENQKVKSEEKGMQFIRENRLELNIKRSTK